MKKIILALTLLSSYSAFADIALTIKTSEGITLNAVGVYASTSRSLFCTRLNGDFERVPKVADLNIVVNRSGAISNIAVEENQENFCRSELKGLSVRVIHSKISQDNATLEVVASPNNQDQVVQKIVFKKFNSPFGDFYGTTTHDILVGPNGIVKAEINLVE